MRSYFRKAVFNAAAEKSKSVSINGFAVETCGRRFVNCSARIDNGIFGADNGNFFIFERRKGESSFV